MATATKTVTEQETITLSLTEREAQLIYAAFCSITDIDPDFTEVRSIHKALRNFAPDYYGKVYLSKSGSDLRFVNV